MYLYNSITIDRYQHFVLTCFVYVYNLYNLYYFSGIKATKISLTDTKNTISTCNHILDSKPKPETGIPNTGFSSTYR